MMNMEVNYYMSFLSKMLCKPCMMLNSRQTYWLEVNILGSILELWTKVSSDLYAAKLMW